MSILDLFGPPNVEKMLAKKDVEGLIKAIEYKERDIQYKAVTSLRKIGNSRAVEALIAALKNKNEYVRETAAKSLGEIGNVDALDSLISALKDHCDVSEKAAWALGKIGSPRAVEPLISAMLCNTVNCKYKFAHAAASNALVSLGMQSVEPLISRLRSCNKYEGEDIAEVLDRIMADWRKSDIAGTMIVEIVALLNAEDGYQRLGAVRALGVIGSNNTIKPLISALKDEYTAEEAKDALLKILSKSAEEISIESLREIAMLGECFKMVVEYERGNGLYSPELPYFHRHPIDCSQLKQLARQDIRRRGMEA